MTLNPKIFDRLHRFADAIGVKPTIVDAFVTTVLLLLLNLLITSDPLDVNAIKAAVYVFVIGAVGIAAPAAQGVDQAAVIEQKPDLKMVTERIRR